MIILAQVFTDSKTNVLHVDSETSKKILEMLPNAAENIEKLQGICAASGKRLMELGQEWESHRRGLIDRLRKPKGAKTERKMKSPLLRLRHILP